MIDKPVPSRWRKRSRNDNLLESSDAQTWMEAGSRKYGHFIRDKTTMLLHEIGITYSICALTRLFSMSE